MSKQLALSMFLALACRAALAELAVDYVTEIKPVLTARCYACRSALRKKSGLRVDTAALLAEGGDTGPAVEPGSSSESLLIKMLTGESGIRMPPEDEGELLSPQQVDLFRLWIDQGAPAPPESPPPDPRDHWAYQPPVRPATPEVADRSWIANPVDAFIAAGHQLHGLSPMPPAEKSVLLRRVYFDLVGLPPTRDELLDFLADDSTQAYENVVDRLLASPQYGERWGRHWMDVWRYSDWSGYMQEIRNSARHIWRWRDWIVESLNADKGYDRMVVEMLAGDELAPSDPNTLRATGFLARNWYKFNRNSWLDNTVEHTAKAFLGVTMNCCRCHDHKYDPISQENYYQMRAIFEPHDVGTDRVPGEPDPVKDGLPRVYDLKPAEPTFVFERGDEKRPDKERPIGPAIPEALGPPLQVVPVDLPLTAWYPALQEFALAEDLDRAARNVADRDAARTKAQSEVAAAQKALAESTASQSPTDAAQVTLNAAVAAAELSTRQLDGARAAHASLAARIAAEKAKCGVTPGADAAQLAIAAGTAERESALRSAEEQVVATQQELDGAKSALKPEDAGTVSAVAEAEKKLAAATTALAAAHAALATPSAEYAPLGEQLPEQSTGRRLALAKWITDRDNPLAARVAVNHIWLRHFGAPLVDNMFDFGLRSPQPRNQLLLDWLAVELMEQNWQMKHLHRLLVTSNAYRMQSGGPEVDDANLAADPDNLFLWRMNVRRLESEAVRDAVLYAADKLDLVRGGPDVDFQLAAASPRRSIYLRHAYEKQARFLELFDGASVNECYRRSESVVPQQALALANSDLSIEQSRILAGQLATRAANDTAPDRAFITLAFNQILSRDPTVAELDQCDAFLAAQAKTLAEPAKLTPFDGGAKPAVGPAADPQQRARENLIHVLYNHNDFVTVR